MMWLYSRSGAEETECNRRQLPTKVCFEDERRKPKEERRKYFQGHEIQ